MKKGIDVSYCQGNINFDKIKKSEVEFCIIRSSFGWEANQKDNYFERNYEGFKRLGIPVGAYHYSYAKTVEQAVKEANYCLECISGKSFELPVFIDMEEASQAAVGRRTCTDIAKTFIQTMEKAGYRSGIYTNPNWLENYLFKSEIVGKFNLWLAQWDSAKPYCDCMLWQYNVGKAGVVSGISGDIDLDYCYSGIEVSKKPVETQKKKSVDELAKEVIAGKWGAGEERKKRLTDAGYDYYAVQNRVNEMMGVKPKKTVDQLAKEVIAGKWGAGEERKKKLTDAGYDYYAVQNKVNEMMGVSTAKIKKGSIVRVKSGAKTYNGVNLASFVFTTNYYVMELQGDRAVIGIDGNVTAAVKVSDLILVR